MCVLYMFFVQTMFNYDTCFPFLFKLLTFLCCLLSFSVDARFAGGDYILAGCRRIEPLGRSSVHRSSRRLFHFFNMQILYTIYIYVIMFARLRHVLHHWYLELLGAGQFLHGGSVCLLRTQMATTWTKWIFEWSLGAV